MNREALSIRIRFFGYESLHVSESLNNLAFVVRDLGRLDEAEALDRQSLSIKRKFLKGGEDLNLAMTLYNLAQVLERKGNLAEAEAAHRQALTIRIRLAGRDHRDSQISMDELVRVLRDEGKLAEAESLMRAHSESSRDRSPAENTHAPDK